MIKLDFKKIGAKGILPNILNLVMFIIIIISSFLAGFSYTNIIISAISFIVLVVSNILFFTSIPKKKISKKKSSKKAKEKKE
jgi:uncharacterized membrane protein